MSEHQKCETKSISSSTLSADNCGYFAGRFRYFILLLTVSSLTAISSNMVSIVWNLNHFKIKHKIAFNFTLILMRRPNWENISLPIKINNEIGRKVTKYKKASVFAYYF